MKKHCWDLNPEHRSLGTGMLHNTTMFGSELLIVTRYAFHSLYMLKVSFICFISFFSFLFIFLSILLFSFSFLSLFFFLYTFYVHYLNNPFFSLFDLSFSFFFFFLDFSFIFGLRLKLIDIWGIEETPLGFEPRTPVRGDWYVT